MSSVCGGLDYKDTESHLKSTSASSSNNGSNQFSGTGADDAQESDGDDSSGNIHPYVNEESKDIITPILESSDDADDEVEENKNLATTAESQSSAVIVIPAIKGSREKHGKPLENLRVSWAEDVYDPPPSLVSHTRSKIQKPQKSKSRDSLKKNGKKGQKGSSSSSSSRGSKDKKSSSSRSKHSRDNKFGWATQTSVVAASS